MGQLLRTLPPGYDHITSAIGGAIAAAAGADFLCYVTPTEHLSLPGPADVRSGVMAARIAAHAADIVKGVKSAWEWDKRMSQFRRKRDWEGQFNTCIDPQVARSIREKDGPRTAKSVPCALNTVCSSSATRYKGIEFTFVVTV